MTACSIIIQGAAGHLLTDTGWFWDDGCVGALRSKVVALPRLRTALAVRGASIHLGSMIATGRPSSAEQLIERMAEYMSSAIEAGRARAPGMTGPDDWSASVYLVFYSPVARRAIGMVMANEADDKMLAGYVPWTWQPVQECLSPGVELTELFGQEPDTADPRASPIEAGALAIIEAQRAERWSVNGGPLAHRVGGAAELTTVDADGVRTRALRTWPDRVGERIEI